MSSFCDKDYRTFIKEVGYKISAIKGSTPIFLGRGKLSVEECCCEGETIESIQNATTLPLYDSAGLVHTLRVVELENGDYTLQLD